jgi:galactitol-specific phosphotransferase system IIB component
MKNYHKNPRKISEESLNDLAKWMKELGDLGGIVHDLNSDEIISGNQRMKVIDLSIAEIEIAQTFDPPTVQGTVALGYVIFENEKFAYRQVAWTAEQCERAVIIANKAGGEWDNFILKEQFDLTVLEESGFSADDIEKILESGNGNFNDEIEAIEKPVYNIVPKFSEKYDAFIIVSTNEIDTNFLKEVLQIETEQSHKSKEIGTSKVISAKKFAELWKSKS